MSACVDRSRRDEEEEKEGVDLPENEGASGGEKREHIREMAKDKRQ